MDKTPILDLTNIKASFPIEFKYVKGIDIKEEVNSHGEMNIVLISEEKITNEDLIKVENSIIKVTTNENNIIFSGVCVNIQASYENEHCKIQIKALGHTSEADITRTNRTFQDTSKTLKQVVESVLSPYGVAIAVPNDISIPQVLSQKNETDWEFVKRISNKYGMYIFTNNKYGDFSISVGAVPFTEFPKDISNPINITKDIDTYLAVKQNINSNCKLFEFIRKTFITADLNIGVGHGIIGDSCLMVAIKSEIEYKNGELTNKVVLGYIDGLYYAPVNLQEDNNNGLFSENSNKQNPNEGSVLSAPDVLTGVVTAVEGNNIQVSFYSESVGGANKWISYNSFFGLDFYCMPDIGDTVFCYYENEGDIICLGSKHINNSHPDFSNPENKVFTANNSMIKHKKDGTDITANRNEIDGYGGKQVKITLSDSEGISIDATKDINMIIEGNMLIQSNDLNVVKTNTLEWFNQEHNIKREKFEEELKIGTKLYNANKGANYNAGWSLAEIVGGNLFEGVVDTVTSPFQIVKTIFGSGETVQEEVELITFEEIEKYQINMLSLNQLTVQIGYGEGNVESQIVFSEKRIDFNSKQLKWLGLNKRNGYPEVSESQRTKMDSILDVFQLGVDFLGLIPIPGMSIVCGAVNTGVSLARGDYFGVACGLMSMFPGGGLAVKGLKAATTATDTVSTASKAMKTLKYLAAGSEVANASILTVKTLYENMDTLLDGEFTIEDLDIITEVSGYLMAGIGEAGTLKDGIKSNGGNKNLNDSTSDSINNNDRSKDKDKEGKNISKESDNEQQNGDKTKGGAESTTTGEKNQMVCGDPIDIVTGSQKLTQKDLLIIDLAEDFIVERIYNSIYTNEYTLLGSKWHLSIGSWLSRRGETIKIMMPTMRIEQFNFKDNKWINKREKDKSVQLIESKTEYILKVYQEEKDYIYDRMGNLKYIEDKNNNKIKFIYNKNYLVQVLFPTGQSLKITYKDRYIETITDGSGRQVRYVYDKDLLKKVIYPNDGVVEYFYTVEGYLSDVIDQRGNEYVKNFYDNRGRVTKQILSNGMEYILLYDDIGRQNTFLKPKTGERTIYSYNKDNLVTKIEYFDSTSEEFEYDENQNKCKIKDKAGGILLKEFDSIGNIVREELPNGLIIISTYDDITNKLIERRDNYGSITRFKYDNNQNITNVSSLISENLWQEIYFEYDKLGRIISNTMPNGEKTKYYYNNNNVKPSRIVTAEGNEYIYEIDELQREVSIKNINGETKYAYNVHNLLSYIIDPLGNNTQYYYDKLSNLTNVISPNGYREQGENIGEVYYYDDFDQVIKIVDENNNVYATPRDAEGNVIKEINPNTYNNDTNDGIGIQYEYDIFDRKTKIILPDGSIERIKYDVSGNIIKNIKPEQYNEKLDDGKGFAYEYDNVNRLTKVIDPNGVALKSYIYDLRGNILEEIDYKGYKKLYKYNKLGWIIEKREPVKLEKDKILYNLVTYDYDTSGNMLKENRYIDFQDEISVEGEVHSIEFDYDKEGRRTKVSDNTGSVMEYVYNGIGQVINEKFKIDNDKYNNTYYIYDKASRLIEVRTSADENSGHKLSTTKYEHDKNGNVIKIITPSGNNILREYDLGNRIISETHKEKKGTINNRTEFSYDKAGNIICITDNNGKKTYIDYDLLNRDIKTIERNGAITRKFYDKNGNLSKIIRPNQYNKEADDGKGYVYTYNDIGQVITIISPTGSVLQSNTYDEENKLVSQVDGQNTGIDFTYDIAGNRTLVKTKGKASQSFEYDARGNIIGVCDGENNHTTYNLDKWGRITTIIKADGSKEHYDYDYSGNIVSSTDGENYTARYEYTKSGKVSKIIDPTGQFETYNYDEENRLKRRNDKNGNIVEFDYNLYGNLISRKSLKSNLFERFNYRADGIIESAISNGMHYNYSYDDIGRLIQKKSCGRNLISYEYDKNGNIIKEVDVTGNIKETAYNELDEMIKICYNGKDIASFDYYENGLKKSVQNGPIVQNYTYDLDNNLTSLLVKNSNKVLVNNNYSYDKNGNRTEKQSLKGLTSYSYDSIGQLNKVVYPTYSEELFYDKRGNRISRIKDGVKEDYNYDPRNRLTELTKGQEIIKFEYDNAGNLIKDNKAKYFYNDFNQTVKVETFDGNIQINRYDAEGLRYEIEENNKLVQFIFNQNNEVIAEKSEEKWESYIRGRELLFSTAEHAKTYYHYVSDEMSSVTHIVDNDTVLNEYEYDAWGEVVTSKETIKNRFKFNGQQLDPITNQYYLRARFYNPVIARFTQEDTYRGDGLNLYAYCRNNPVYYVDPTGYVADCIKELFIMLREEYDMTAQQAHLVAKKLKSSYSIYKYMGNTKKDSYGEAKKYVFELGENGKPMQFKEFKSVTGIIYNRSPEWVLYKKIYHIGAEYKSNRYEIKDNKFIDNSKALQLTSKKIDTYKTLKADTTISGQAHHLNQDAAYGEIIPTNEGISINLNGNAFIDRWSEHYRAHNSLEKFWDQYRPGGVKQFMPVTNLDYSNALYDSMLAAGFNKQDALDITNKAKAQREEYGLKDSDPVPRVPYRINQKK